MVPNEDEQAPQTVPDVVIEQARDIGDATARLELLTAAHETTKAAVDDTKNSVQWLGDRVTSLESTIAKMAEDVAALKPAAAVEEGAQGAANEADAAIDTIDPQRPAENAGERKRGPLSWIHDHLS